MLRKKKCEVKENRVQPYQIAKTDKKKTHFDRVMA